MNLLWKAAKEPLRELVLALIPVVLVMLEKMEAPWAAGLYIALRYIDQYLHEAGKAKDNENMSKGIVRF